MTVTFELKGTEGMFKTMKSLEDKVEKRIAKKAVRAAGTFYARQVRKQIPMDTEDDVHLKKSIGVAGVKGRRKNDIRVQVGVKGPARQYAHLYEYGSKHMIGTRVFTRTLEQQAQPIADKMITTLRRELDKIG